MQQLPGTVAQYNPHGCTADLDGARCWERSANGSRASGAVPPSRRNDGPVAAARPPFGWSAKDCPVQGLPGVPRQIDAWRLWYGATGPPTGLARFPPCRGKGLGWNGLPACWANRGSSTPPDRCPRAGPCRRNNVHRACIALGASLHQMLPSVQIPCAAKNKLDLAQSVARKCVRRRLGRLTINGHCQRLALDGQ